MSYTADTIVCVYTLSADTIVDCVYILSVDTIVDCVYTLSVDTIVDCVYTLSVDTVTPRQDRNRETRSSSETGVLRARVRSLYRRWHVPERKKITSFF